jgi:hypothetical protein
MHTVFIGKHFLLQLAVFFDFFWNHMSHLSLF